MASLLTCIFFSSYQDADAKGSVSTHQEQPSELEPKSEHSAPTTDEVLQPNARPPVAEDYAPAGLPSVPFDRLAPQIKRDNPAPEDGRLQ